MPDVLILVDQQKAKEHPKWGPRNNPEAEKYIARLLATWRAQAGRSFMYGTIRPIPMRHSDQGRTATISVR
jgi:hypothetical protein